MKFEKAIELMLRGGCTIRRESWEFDRCMFVDIDPRRHASYLIQAYGKWPTVNCSLESDDYFAQDWECCVCPESDKYPSDIRPATICLT